MTEGTVRCLIIAHAALGGAALLAGAVALSVRKGHRPHRIAGKAFMGTMLASAAIGCAIALMPGHENVFLFAIGLFSSYFILSGYRALQDGHRWADALLAWAILAIGAFMLLWPVLAFGMVNAVLAVFGGVGIFFGITDLLRLRQSEVPKVRRLRLHLGKMTGGYIAAVTAFVVVNGMLPGIWGWFAPGLLGGVFIAYWLRRVGAGR